MTEFSEWVYRTPGDIEREMREAYERNDTEWLKEQASNYPLEFLTAANTIGVAMPWASQNWLRERAAGRGADGLRWLVAREQRILRPTVSTPTPRASVQPPVERPVERPQERCLDCGDLLPRYRHIPRCVRCNKVHREAAALARQQQPQVERPTPTYHCLACKRTFTMQVQGRRLCPRCFDERYVEQPSENDGVLVRNTGAIPHLAFYMNRRGESVVKGRILPHPRYGESRNDRFGDTPELED